MIAQTIGIFGPVAPSLKENFWADIWSRVVNSPITILDLSQVTEIDKLTVCYLGVMQAVCRDNDGNLILVGVQGITDPSRLAELHKIFRCFNDTEAAIASFATLDPAPNSGYPNRWPGQGW